MHKEKVSKVTRLIRSLQIVDEDILREAAYQPMLFVKAARYRVDKMRARSQAEAELEQFTAIRGLRVRASNTEGKPTEGYIKSLVHKHSHYRELKSAVSEAEAQEELGKLLIKAYEMRAKSIDIIAYAERKEAARGTSLVERDDANRKLSKEIGKLYDRRDRTRTR